MVKVPWWNTYIGEEESKAVASSIKNKNIGMGSITEKFEHNIANILNVPYVVATPNASTALYISLMVMGIGVGDEVILPDRTFIATAHAVRLTGAEVILVDCNKHNTNIDISKIEEKITSNTKAIIPVHLNGRSVDMEAINLIAKQNELIVIEDTSQSLFSKNKGGKYLGTLSNIGCFSLGLAKLITVGFGGFIVIHDENIYHKILKFRNHGREGITDNKYFEYDTLGFNFKVSDIIMSIALVQLSKYREKIQHIVNIYELYLNSIKNLDFIDILAVDIENEVPLYIEVISEKREELMMFLDENKIETNYLPPSLHLSKHLKQKHDDFDNSLFFNKNSFILPCGPSQDIDNIKRVIEVLEKFNEI